MNWGNKLAISIAGGKGGVGKSCFAASLGVTLAQQGRKVVLVDADIGAANLHTLVGVPRPDRTLADFMGNRYTALHDVMIPTPYENLKLLSSASDILAVASPNHKMNQKLFQAVRKIAADVIIFDIAAGTHYRAIDFFAVSPVGIIMVEPLPTSLENAFLFIKNLVYRFLLRVFYHDTEMKEFIRDAADPSSDRKLLQFDHLIRELEARAPDKIAIFRKYFLNHRMCIVANAVRNPSQLEVIERFVKIVKRYIGFTSRVLGVLPYETRMDAAITSRTPFVVKYPDSDYRKGVLDIVSNITN